METLPSIIAPPASEVPGRPGVLRRMAVVVASGYANEAAVRQLVRSTDREWTIVLACAANATSATDAEPWVREECTAKGQAVAVFELESASSIVAMCADVRAFWDGRDESVARAIVAARQDGRALTVYTPKGGTRWAPDEIRQDVARAAEIAEMEVPS